MDSIVRFMILLILIGSIGFGCTSISGIQMKEPTFRFEAVKRVVRIGKTLPEGEKGNFTPSELKKLCSQASKLSPQYLYNDEDYQPQVYKYRFEFERAYTRKKTDPAAETVLAADCASIPSMYLLLKKSRSANETISIYLHSADDTLLQLFINPDETTFHHVTLHNERQVSFVEGVDPVQIDSSRWAKLTDETYFKPKDILSSLRQRSSINITHLANKSFLIINEHLADDTFPQSMLPNLNGTQFHNFTQNKVQVSILNIDCRQKVDALSCKYIEEYFQRNDIRPRMRQRLCISAARSSPNKVLFVNNYIPNTHRYCFKRFKRGDECDYRNCIRCPTYPPMYLCLDKNKRFPAVYPSHYKVLEMLQIEKTTPWEHYFLVSSLRQVYKMEVVQRIRLGKKEDQPENELNKKLLSSFNEEDRRKMCNRMLDYMHDSVSVSATIQTAKLYEFDYGYGRRSKQFAVSCTPENDLLGYFSNVERERTNHEEGVQTNIVLVKPKFMKRSIFKE